MLKRILYLTTSVGLATTIMSSTALAQTVDEIVVTAQKKQESIQEVPISVVAVTGEALLKTGAPNLASVAELAPNVVIDDAVTLGGSSASTSIYIRGVGQSDFLTTTDPGVGLYLDGVYISRSVGSLLDVADVERVEVLRGPQGTLYGKNTIGGAINVVTSQPADEFAALGRVTFGTDNRQDILARVDLPLSDVITSQVTIGSLKQDGYVDRPLAGDALGEKDKFILRGKVRIEPSDTFSVNLAGDYTKSDETGGPATLLDTFQLCPAGVFAPFCDGTVEAGPPGQVFFFNNVPPITAAAGGIPEVSQFNDSFLPDTPFLSQGTFQSVSELELWGVSATLDWNTTFADIKSITAYRTYDTFFTRDADHSPFDIYHTTADVQHSQFSQEFQFSGDFAESGLSWLGGLYYLEESADDDSQLILASLTIQSGGTDIDTTSKAIYGQVTYDVTEDLSLTGGIRYTEEDKDYLPTQFIAFSNPALVPPQPPTGAVTIPAVNNEVSFDQTTYRATADYQVTDDILLYGSFSTGFKSGGFVQRNQAPRDLLPIFEPEDVTVFEGGFKSKLFDNRLLLNGAVFNTDYDNIQVRVIEVSGFAPITANAAAAKITGFELEFEGAVTEGLTLSGGLGHLDARYTEIGADLADITLDSSFVNTPEWSYNLSAVQDFNLPTGTLSGRVDWSHQSEVYNDAENTPVLRQDAVDLVNVSVNYRHEPAQGLQWGLTGGIRNLTDEVYLVSGNANRSLGSFVGTFNRGQEWFASLEVEF